MSPGPYSCIGKPLALMNIRATIAKLVCTFDIVIPAGEDLSAFEGSAIDHFMLSFGELRLSLSLRTTTM